LCGFTGAVARLFIPSRDDFQNGVENDQAHDDDDSYKIDDDFEDFPSSNVCPEFAAHLVTDCGFMVWLRVDVEDTAKDNQFERK